MSTSDDHSTHSEIIKGNACTKENLEAIGSWCDLFQYGQMNHTQNIVKH